MMMLFFLAISMMIAMMIATVIVMFEETEAKQSIKRKANLLVKTHRWITHA